MMKMTNSNKGRNSDRKTSGRARKDSPRGFLRSETDKPDLGQLHKEYLGMEIPDGYFAESKRRILDALSPADSIPHDKETEEKVVNQPEKKSIGRIFGLNRVVYPLAASILLLIAIAIGLQKDQPVEAPAFDQESVVSRSLDLQDTDDFLVRSLLVDDEEIDLFTDDYLIDQVLVQAELSEQELENIFINSLFIEDSLVDEYLEESLVEQVIL